MAGFEKISSRSYDLPEGKLEENIAPQRSSSEAHVFWKSATARTRKRCFHPSATVGQQHLEGYYCSPTIPLPKPS
jgi:hypothetical protein